jgi:hypothetical protein
MLNACLLDNAFFGNFAISAKASDCLGRKLTFEKSFKSQESFLEEPFKQFLVDQYFKKFVSRTFLGIQESQNLQQNIFRSLQASLIADFLLGSEGASEVLSSHV